MKARIRPILAEESVEKYTLEELAKRFSSTPNTIRTILSELHRATGRHYGYTCINRLGERSIRYAGETFGKSPKLRPSHDYHELLIKFIASSDQRIIIPYNPRNSRTLLVQTVMNARRFYPELDVVVDDLVHHRLLIRKPKKED